MLALDRDLGHLDVHLHRDPETRRDLPAQRLADFGIEMREQPRLRVDDRDFDTERGEDAGILTADDAASDHDHAARNLLQGEQ